MHLGEKRRGSDEIVQHSSCKLPGGEEEGGEKIAADRTAVSIFFSFPFGMVGYLKYGSRPK